MRGTALCLALAAALISGCASLDTPYVRPEMATAPAWRHAEAATAPAATAPAEINPAGAAQAAAADPWWRQFRDPQLDALVERALARNNDLAAATLRVRRAQLQAGLAGNDRWPQLGGSVSAGGDRPLEGGAATTRSASAGLSVSYEADLWNRLGNLHDAARWEAVATAEDREATRLALIATAANLHFQSIHLRERLAMGEQDLDTARHTLDLVASQYAAGAVSGLEMAEARATVVRQEIAQAQRARQAAETANALEALLDGEPAPPATASLDRIALPGVAAGIPAELLSRRPDLRAAESRLRAGLSTADAASAAFYPTLSLTGSAGSSSAALADVLSNPVGSLAAGLALPFLNLQRARLSRAVSRNQYEEAATAFRQTFRQALAEVDDALSARAQLALQGEQQARLLTEARAAERLYGIRYRAGAVALRDWLAAQEALRAAEAAVLDTRLAQLGNQVALYQSLGGDSRHLGR